jgi:hypothetical protein
MLQIDAVDLKLQEKCYILVKRVSTLAVIFMIELFIYVEVKVYVYLQASGYQMRWWNCEDRFWCIYLFRGNLFSHVRELINKKGAVFY